MRRLSLGLCLLLFTACIAHEKNGDSAAALGDWRSAYYEYGKALEGEPGSATIKGKYDKARAEAINQAAQKARACATSGDWGCALEHSDFVLSVDGGNQEMAVLRVQAARTVSMGWVQSARDAGAHGNFSQAFELIGRAVSTSNDAEVATAAQGAKQEVLAKLDVEVDRLRGQSAYPQALQHLELATRVDPAHQPRLDTVRHEHAAWLEARYEERARAGDLSLQQRRWGEAAGHYQAALAIHPGGRAEALFQYAAGVDQGELALARQDFRGAADGFRRAAASGMDRDGYAAQMADRTEIRPYQVRLRSVLVYAFRPGGLPWAGRRDPAFDSLARALAYTSMPRGAAAPEAAIAQARTIPPEFAPTLQVEAMIPGRGQLVTVPLRGLYALYDASFVVLTNGFDARPLQIRVHHVGERPEEAGGFSIPLRDLVSAGRLTVADRAVARMELFAQAAPGLHPNSVIGWGQGPLASAPPEPPPPPPGPPPGVGVPGPPPPGGPGGRFRLAEIAVRLGREDRGRGHRGPPDPVIEVEQGSATVFRAQADRVFEAQWTPAGAHLNPMQRLRVKLYDSGEAAPVLDVWVDPRAMGTGAFETSTPRGSWIRLVFAGRR